MFGTFEFRLARRYLFGRRGGAFVGFISLISVSGVAVGGAALVFALALMNGFQGAIRDRLLGANADLSLIAGGAGIDTAERAALEEFLRGDPAVAAVAPVAGGAGLIASDFSREARMIKLVGIEPAQQRKVVDLQRYVKEGDLNALAAGRIFLGKDLAATMGVRVNDTVRITVPSLTVTPLGAVPRSRRFLVAGIVDSGYFQYDSENGYLELAEAQDLLGLEERVSSLLVRCRDHSLLAGLKARIQPKLRGSEIAALDLEEINRDFFKALRTEKLALTIGISLILAVAVLNIASMLTLLVVEKVRAIGILTALGATPVQIQRSFLLMGLLIGAIGTALGVGGGALLAYLADHGKWFRLSLTIYPVDYVPFQPRLLDCAGVALLTLTIALLATLYPAWKAARFSPVEALRYE